MEDKISKEVALFGKLETTVSGFLVIVALIFFFSDVLFHIGGGFLAAGALGFGIPALVGYLAGLVTLKSKYFGALLNLVLSGIIFYFCLPIVKTSLEDLGSYNKFDRTYPDWGIVCAAIFLAFAAYVIFFFLRVFIKFRKF